MDTSFDLESFANGRTRLTVRARHELRLDPILYWLPMARWIIEENHERVLRQIRTQAEQEG